jgi:AcrR family transcriptional regulator
MGAKGFHQMSMQEPAAEANVSVGLIYTYFGGKEDLLLATIVRILDVFRDQLAPVMDAAGNDVVDRLAAGIRRYIQIVDANLDGVVLTYRESRTLGPADRARIKELEIATAAPLRAVIETGIARGVFRDVDVDLTVFDVMLLAHGWAPSTGTSGRSTPSTNTTHCRPAICWARWLPMAAAPIMHTCWEVPDASCRLSDRRCCRRVRPFRVRPGGNRRPGHAAPDDAERRRTDHRRRQQRRDSTAADGPRQPERARS